MSDTAYCRWICDACGYIYDEEKGDPDSGLAPGTRFEAIPDTWQCPLCGLSKADLRPIPEMANKAHKPNKTPRSTSDNKCRGGEEYVVIVGGGIAGWSVAESIRRYDHETPLLLISACEGLSYPKPALSTALAQGKSAQDLVDEDAASKAAALNLSVRTETRVIKIDPKKRRLTTAKGGIQYGKLILALGAHQRQLSIAGDAAETILQVNDLATYKKLRKRLENNVQHVTILGAGLIGCEFAEDIASAGYQVSIVDPTDYPLKSLLPVETATQLRHQLENRGIQWHFNVTLDRAEHSGKRLRAIFSDGKAIETDLILSAAGLIANTQLAKKSGLSISHGINTDRLMHTSESNIYAIGDCAAVEGEVFCYIEPIRRQAESIAADLRGEYLPFDTLPPLVRVKTPSFPLTICPPRIQEDAPVISRKTADRERMDYLQNDQLVGFVLSGNSAKKGINLYRELFT
ncbi:MAG: FAD-dependent oxidoreductase [Candidatus Thiodiazotropha sp.]|jgi:rubredoxin---NAD+ reductase